MTSHRSPLPYELPQPHASTSKQTVVPTSPRNLFQPIDQNRPQKRPSNESSPHKAQQVPKRARAATPIAALPSEQSQDREPSTALFVPEEEGEEEGVLFSEEQAEDDEEDGQTLIPETTEPLVIEQAEIDCDPEEDVDGHGGQMDPLGIDQGDHGQPLDAMERGEESEEGSTHEDDGEEDDVDENGDQEDYGDMSEDEGYQGAAAQRPFAYYESSSENSSDETEEPSDGYHSGDSLDYDMAHRPILERTLIKKDLRQLMSEFGKLGWRGDFQPLDRLGEGTFSSVYLAMDMKYYLHDNRYWAKGIPNNIGLGEIDRPKNLDAGVKVALKKILATSSPQRIENELHILEYLRGSEFVTELIGGFRDKKSGGTMIVMPFFDGDDFRLFYKDMDLEHIRSYMFTLLFGLYEIHRRGIIHRDIKPANFLYNYEQQTGMICDFGLAERYVVPRKIRCQHTAATLENLHGVKQHTEDTRTVEQAHYDANKRNRAGDGKIGFLKDDKRPTIRTNRAGTRGFRAPEVLLKCPDQTAAIDIWSAGVILLGILTQKFPPFNSADDTEALMEIASLFGRQSVERCALLHNRTIVSNVPAIDLPRPSLKNIILQMNPHLYTPPTPDVTPEEARTHIEDVDKVLSLCVDMLTLDATKRPTARKLLKHKFFQTDQIKQMWADRPKHYEDVHGELKIIHPTMGKCGQLHSVEGNIHLAMETDGEMYPMLFGEGYPLAPGHLCPLHEHLQQRMGKNIIAHIEAGGDRLLLPNPEPTRRAVQEVMSEDTEDMD